MSSLGDKTVNEICALLDEYGIKHGPVVDSTRGLYEKKLRDAMAKDSKEKTIKPSPDETHNREGSIRSLYEKKLKGTVAKNYEKTITPSPDKTYNREGSSRSLYEKKLKGTVAKNYEKTIAPSPDKTYNREDSTRSLYEKRIKEAMAKDFKEKTIKPPSDKTYYREEEDVTYVYRTPVRNEGPGERTAYMRARSEWPEREYDHRTPYSGYSRSRHDFGGRDAVDESQMYDSPSTYRSSYLQSTPLRSGEDAPKAEKSSRLVPLWVQLVVFLGLAVFLYFVFSNMETNESFKEIDSQ